METETMTRMIRTLFAAVLLAPMSLAAQGRVSLELRGGAAFPTENLADAELDTGLGFEATIAYHFVERLAVYGGWGWRHFSSDASFAGTDLDFEETGYVAGLRFRQPFGSARRVALQLHGGALYDHIEVEDADGDLVTDTGHGLGWEAGAALVFGFGNGWELTPGVKYRSLARDFEIANVTTEGNLRYVAAEIGIAKRLGR
jgi:hypothetical protein